jgi:cation diffusion facilitator CzcD-associated flavoprotein CzcO
VIRTRVRPAALRRRRSDVDDVTASLAQERQRELGEKERSAQVRAKDAVEILDSQRIDAGSEVDARVVDERIETSRARACLLDQSTRVLLAADVAAQRMRCRAAFSALAVASQRSLRSATSTIAPAAASSSQIAAPSPWPPPVTRTDLP